MDFLTGLSILSQALVRCKVKDDEIKYKRVLDSIKILVFFGAPHEGLSTAGALEKMITDLDLPNFERARRIMEPLIPRSANLERHTRTFKNVASGRGWNILSLFETVETATVKVVG